MIVKTRFEPYKYKNKKDIYTIRAINPTFFSTTGIGWEEILDIFGNNVLRIDRKNYFAVVEASRAEIDKFTNVYPEFKAELRIKS